MKKASIPNPALAPLGALIGQWTTAGAHPHLPGVTLRGRAECERIAGGAFIAMRTEVDHPEIPAGIAVFGTDGTAEETFMLYFDERTVSRKFDVNLRDNVVVAVLPGFPGGTRPRGPAPPPHVRFNAYADTPPGRSAGIPMEGRQPWPRSASLGCTRSALSVGPVHAANPTMTRTATPATTVLDAPARVEFPSLVKNSPANGMPSRTPRASCPIARVATDRARWDLPAPSAARIPSSPSAPPPRTT